MFQPITNIAMKSNVLIPLILSIIASTAFAADSAGLIRLYEDEMLAHDLYTELGKVHQELMPLQNIPRSESVHQSVMAGILKSRGIALPQPPAGRKFASDGLDETYAKWLEEGRESPLAACRVGVRLEEYDIAELRAAAKSVPEISATLANLERASGNHLRAFYRNLTSRQGRYQPEVLKAKDFKAILNAGKRPARQGDGQCVVQGAGQGAGQAGCAGCGRNTKR